MRAATKEGRAMEKMIEEMKAARQELFELTLEMRGPDLVRVLTALGEIGEAIEILEGLNVTGKV